MSEFSTHSRRARFLPGWNRPCHKRVPRSSSDSTRWIPIETKFQPIATRIYLAPEAKTNNLTPLIAILRAH